MHQLFEAQVERTPEQVAVVFEGASLRYRELNERANRLAHYLRAQGVGPDCLVGICVERSLEMVVGVLAILKAGGAYVPLDPSYPKERLAYMLSDAAPTVLLTQRSLLQVLSEASVVLCLDAAEQELDAYPGTNPVPLAQPRHLAYVIYTSGSTGQPKGVMVEHAQVTRLFDATREQFKFTASDVWPLFHSVAFDFSVWEIWGALLHGGQLSIVPQALTRDPEGFWKMLCEQGVTVLNQTPGAFRQLLAAQGSRPHSLRTVIFGGEALDVSLLKPWFERALNAGTRLVNMYGITETTVHVTYKEIEPAEARLSRASPIGRRIADLQVYVLDAQRQPVPVGLAGELYVGGAGVARGYWRRATLTAERFIDSPFNPGERLYKTGDLARYLPDGNLEYLGRNDDQVKIRGFRIELGEIEAALRAQPQVREAVVLAREDAPGDKRLVAYVTRAKESAALDVEPLRAALAAKLPEYMVPALFVVLDEVPLTSSGKIDKKALPAPDASSLAIEYVAPRTQTESKLIELCAQLLQLKLEEISTSANFFALGGHSLLVMQLVALLRQAGLKADVKTIYGAASLRDLAAALDEADSAGHGSFSAPLNLIPPACDRIEPNMLPLVSLSEQEIERIVATVPGGAKNVQDIYPLAPLQEGLLFFHLLHRQNDPYVVPTLFCVENRVRFDALKDAVQQVIDRHDVLRTAVLSENVSTPVQVVYRHADLPIETLELDPARDAMSQMQARFDEPQVMDISRAPMLRIRAARDPHSEKIYVLFQIHHLIEDVTSASILEAEVRACLARQADRLATPALYREFVAHALHQARHSDAQTFFRKMLGDVTEPTAPFNLLDVHGDGTDIAEAQKSLDRALARRIRQVARQRKCSPAILFHTAWALVVAACSGRSDVVFGTVLSGRLQGASGVQQMLGMFINTLPLRLRLEGMSVAQMVEQVGHALRDLLPYEQVPLSLAQQCSGLAANASLFSALFNYRHSQSAAGRSLVDALDVMSGAEEAGITLIHSQDRSNYPFSASIDDSEQDFSIEVQVDRSIDPNRVIGYIETALAGIVRALQEQPEKSVLSLAVLPASERQHLLYDLNATDAPYPQDQCVHQLFEEQVERTPEHVAVVFEGASLRYRELNERANRLAHYLRAQGVGPDCLVGICVERSLEMVVGVLAILKAGGAYVPLDPSYPKERLAYMLSDAAPKVLLTQRSLIGVLPEASVVLCLDAAEQELGAYPSMNPVPLAQPRHLAYVIYTSGSTGQPKGVMVEHAQVVNHNTAISRELSLTRQDRVLQFASLSFDAAVEEIFPSLQSGATLYVRNGAESVDEFCRDLVRWRITVLNLPTAYWRVWVDALDGNLLATSQLRTVVIGGDTAPGSTFNRWIGAGGAAIECLNTYGPTEATVSATLHRLPKVACEGSLPIGRPIANVHIYILDERGEPTPIGVSGEIHIGGAGVARGYLNRSDLTARRFVENRFSRRAGARMYKTGDMGRYLADGSIEFLGRNDDQVKVRGFRIELGEIESVLRAQPRVREAVVLARADVPGEKRLVAYVLATKGSAAPSPEQLRAAVAVALPEYMVPAAYVVLDALPLTPNGKVDRKALPAVEGEAFGQQHYEPPAGELEQTLARIWSELLGVQQVGRRHRFFELGGHSLLIVQLLSRLRQQNLDIEVRSVFDAPELQAMAGKLRRITADRYIDQMISIRAGSERRRPLFMIHDVSGEALPYERLSRFLDADLPIYGIRVDHDFVHGAVTIQELAARYVGLIRRVQPEGPYRLAGWSLGGDLAYEMAYQLLGRDERVEFVGLIDSFAVQEAVEPRALVEAIAECRSRGWLAHTLGSADIERALSSSLNLAQALQSYRPSALPAPVHLFTAQPDPEADPSHGWKTLLGANLTTEVIGGDHFSIMLEDAHLETLGAALSRCLSHIESDPPPAPGSYKAAVSIQTGRSGAITVFCVPGAGANVTSFLPLTDALGSTCNVIGLRARGHDSGSIPHTSVEAAAKAYLRELREMKLRGPCYLLGHSFGGWIAFEMARQLSVAGDSVAPVILVDTEVPGLFRRAGRLEALRRFVAVVEMDIGRSLQLQFEELMFLDERAQLQRLLRQLTASKVLPVRTTFETLSNIIRVFESHLNTGYLPATRFDGVILRINAERQSADDVSYRIEEPGAAKTWSDYAAEVITVTLSGANHMSILKAPHVGGVAAEIEAVWPASIDRHASLVPE
ncbi:MAG TPA: amino acid adenylation domain-containing protein [Steroidobacter sp.]